MTPLKSDSPVLKGPLPVVSPEPKAQAVSTKPCCFSSLSWSSTHCDPRPISTELATALTWSPGTADLLSRYAQTTHSYLVLFSWNILSDPQLQMFLDSGNLRQAVSPRTNQNTPPETVSRSDFSRLSYLNPQRPHSCLLAAVLQSPTWPRLKSRQLLRTAKGSGCPR